jgi:serine/threonine protein kinase
MVVGALRLAEGAEPFPGYRLGPFLGQGGWGEVWQATQADGRAVALKFLAADSQAAAAQEIRSLQAIRHLRHPHLLQIEQIWSTAGYLVIAMELAEGSLLDLLQIYETEFHQGIFAEHLCFFLAQAAAALDFLNTRQHLVSGQRVAFRHCDVKPSNLLIRGKVVKVADFGLAVQTTSPMWYHRRVGTHQYTAPEVLRGWLSEKSDQYSLAVSYCHLRSGRLPFGEIDSESLDVDRPPPDLSALSAAERRVIRRALDPVPQDRWCSCSELIQRLARCPVDAVGAVS